MSSAAEYDLVVVNGIVVTHEDIGEQDIAVKNGKIARVVPRGALNNTKAKRIINAEGGYVMP